MLSGLKRFAQEVIEQYQGYLRFPSGILGVFVRCAVAFNNIEVSFGMLNI